MRDLLSVETVAFTVLGYPMSYIELFGTILYLASVWLIARRHMLTWPVGILSVLLYMALFYQIRLYSDALEQIYYLGASVYGWWYWSKTQTEKHVVEDVRFSASSPILLTLCLTAVLGALAGAAMSRAHLALPSLFPEPASYPYVDALTTVMSFTAMGLMTRKRIESWLYWIVVDVLGIWLYSVKGVKLIALLYLILLGLAFKGLASWLKAGGVLATPAAPRSAAARR
ncbi:MAG TPA: nicotinamide riboside transporter PnuC [Gemmatimonadales bacterium]|nr:nicotinamide riboside transporter PnuC [Gemmatimonadales bacterium]